MAVRIEVTSENGEVDNYYLVISKSSAAEDGNALLEKIKNDNKLAADQAIADPVIASIDAIGAVTLDSKTAIEAARAAYDALTDAQKALVTNYEILTAAEKTIADLNPNSPPTGDNAPIVLFAMLMITSVACLTVLTLYEKKYVK